MAQRIRNRSGNGDWAQFPLKNDSLESIAICRVFRFAAQVAVSEDERLGAGQARKPAGGTVPLRNSWVEGWRVLFAVGDQGDVVF